jgi:hypothetical protein
MEKLCDPRFLNNLVEERKLRNWSVAKSICQPAIGRLRRTASLSPDWTTQ